MPTCKSINNCTFWWQLKNILKTNKDAGFPPLILVLSLKRTKRDKKKTTSLSARYSETTYGVFPNKQQWLKTHWHWHILPFPNFVNLCAKGITIKTVVVEGNLRLFFSSSTLPPSSGFGENPAPCLS